METASMGDVMPRPKAQSADAPEGFSLLEMMIVVTVILIVASIATPIYQTCATRAREAVLRDHLFTLRALIDRFTLDTGRAPFRLEELVEKGYLGRLPTDPFTGSGVGNRE
jgi:general secretion pathway protein G